MLRHWRQLEARNALVQGLHGGCVEKIEDAVILLIAEAENAAKRISWVLEGKLELLHLLLVSIFEAHEQEQAVPRILGIDYDHEFSWSFRFQLRDDISLRAVLQKPRVLVESRDHGCLFLIPHNQQCGVW